MDDRNIIWSQKRLRKYLKQMRVVVSKNEIIPQGVKLIHIRELTEEEIAYGKSLEPLAKKFLTKGGI